MNWHETFDMLQDLQKKVCYVKGWSKIVFVEQSGYRFKDFDHESFFITVGSWNEEEVLDAFVNEENEPLGIQKEGFYNFEAILSYDEGESDEYGRKYAASYMMIEHIEYKYQCSIADHEAVIGDETDPNNLGLFLGI